MKTTKEERAHWKPLFEDFDAGSALEFTSRLIADVDDATALLQELWTASDAIGPDEQAHARRLTAAEDAAADFLKEPSDGD